MKQSSLRPIQPNRVLGKRGTESSGQIGHQQLIRKNPVPSHFRLDYYWHGMCICFCLIRIHPALAATIIHLHLHLSILTNHPPRSMSSVLATERNVESAYKQMNGKKTPDSGQWDYGWYQLDYTRNRITMPESKTTPRMPFRFYQGVQRFSSLYNTTTHQHSSIP